jgi:hypothetical protein
MARNLVAVVALGTPFAVSAGFAQKEFGVATFGAFGKLM